MAKTNAKDTRVYGLHAVSSVLQHKPDRVKCVWVQEQRQDKRLNFCLQQLKEQGITLHTVDRATLDKLVDGAAHQGIIAACLPSPVYSDADLPSLLAGDAAKLILILDGVKDPHNVGACLRSANAFAADFVIVPQDRACGITPVVEKVACGATALTPIVQVKNLARSLGVLKQAGVWCVGLVMDADMPLSQVDFSRSTALIMGSEDKGMRSLTAKNCDFLASIPMSGQMESLNISVAAGIALYQARHSR